LIGSELGLRGGGIRLTPCRSVSYGDFVLIDFSSCFLNTPI
jgi:hypothetical protein